MMPNSYLRTTLDFYRDAALNPQSGLCCTTSPVWSLPDLEIPAAMQDMNYGCGTTVHLRDLSAHPTVLYVGIGGGMELLQFSYFTRFSGGVIGVDPVAEMIEVCSKNLVLAEKENPWFRRDFIDLRVGDALDLPLPDQSVQVAAQNCLFNIFKPEELRRALAEMFRVLKPGGRLVLSDPIADDEIPDNLRKDDRLRAQCLTGALPLARYIDLITETGFGTVEVRARRPYRVLDPAHYDTPRLIFIESVEVCAIKDPMPADGPCIFTGKTAIYFGDQELFDDGKGHQLQQNQPSSVCDKTAANLSALGRSDLLISDSTWFYDGGGCC